VVGKLKRGQADLSNNQPVPFFGTKVLFKAARLPAVP